MAGEWEIAFRQSLWSDPRHVFVTMPNNIPAQETASYFIRNVRIVDPNNSVSAGDILIHEGKIAAWGKIDPTTLEACEWIDGAGRLLTPGLIDVHTHGIMQYLYTTSREDFILACAQLGQFGVTAILPTIVPQVEPGWLEQLSEIADAIPEVKSVNVPGLHLEGPFLAIKGSAAPTLPGDLRLLEEIITTCRGRMTAMSVSPETPNIISVIERLVENGTKVFLTHTRASPEQTDAAIEAGATHATHFYDVFYSPEEKDPGVRPVGAVESILADPRVSVDFICDGIHVHPAAIRAAVAAKGSAGVCLITDAVIGAGLPPAIYDTPWGFQIRVQEGDAPRHATEGYLTGSGLTMDQGMRNLLDWLYLPEQDIWAMGSANPARMLGLNTTGRMAVGASADLVLWNANLRASKTWVNGRLSFAEKWAE